MIQEVDIETTRGIWHATLFLPADLSGILVLVPGRTQAAFQVLSTFTPLLRSGVGMLLLDEDLWTRTEAEDALIEDLERGMNLGELAGWLADYEGTSQVPWGLLGAGEGALPAMVAAVGAEPGPAALIVMDGGPDMASADLESIEAPTLLIVSADSPLDVEIHHVIAEALHCSSSVAVVHNLLEVRAVVLPWLLEHFHPPFHAKGQDLPLGGAYH